MKKWNDTEIQELTRLRKIGYSPREISKRMDKTRNSILGKLFRLGLCKAGNP